MTAERLMLLGGIGSFVLTLYWVRSRDLREKYAVGWTALAALVLVIGLFPESIMWLANMAHLSYPAAVLFIALGLIYVFSFVLTVSLTRHYRANVRLTQDYAILEERLRRVEQELRHARIGTDQSII